MAGKFKQVPYPMDPIAKVMSVRRTGGQAEAVTPEDVKAKYDALTEDQRKEFFSLLGISYPEDLLY